MKTFIVTVWLLVPLFLNAQTKKEIVENDTCWHDWKVDKVIFEGDGITIAVNDCLHRTCKHNWIYQKDVSNTDFLIAGIPIDRICEKCLRYETVEWHFFVSPVRTKFEVLRDLILKTK